MKRIIAAALLVCSASAVAASTDTGMEGTHWVQFQPQQSMGELEGCSLVFLTVVRDFKYKNGDYIALNGSINLSKVKNNFGLSFKIGAKDMNAGTPFERPAFAYIQTKNATTAKSALSTFDGEPGYSFYVYNATDKEPSQVLMDVVENAKVQIGYNFKVGGLDVLAPLDLFVVNSKLDSEKIVSRQTSPDILISFGQCVETVVSSVLKDIK
jgi:hypothetical protein